MIRPSTTTDSLDARSNTEAMTRIHGPETNSWSNWATQNSWKPVTKPVQNLWAEKKVKRRSRRFSVRLMHSLCFRLPSEMLSPPQPRFVCVFFKWEQTTAATRTGFFFCLCLCHSPLIGKLIRDRMCLWAKSEKSVLERKRKKPDFGHWCDWWGFLYVIKLVNSVSLGFDLIRKLSEMSIAQP